VYLKKHTVAQAITGAILGFVLAAVALSLLLLYAPGQASV
jgi:tetrahydromethanopterin S-methyltransferase subunit F